MKHARFVAAAREELLLEVRYYNAQHPGLGARFTQSVEDATARALAFPMSGGHATKNTKRVFVKDFPFSVIYRPSAEGIIVFALAHHRRRPDYWRSRVQER